MRHEKTCDRQVREELTYISRVRRTLRREVREELTYTSRVRRT